MCELGQVALCESGSRILQAFEKYFFFKSCNVLPLMKCYRINYLQTGEIMGTFFSFQLCHLSHK